MNHVELSSVIRETDFSKLSANNYESMAKKISSNMSKDEVETILSLFKRAVESTASDQEFANYLESGELPPIKLNANELELIRGGGILAIVVRVVQLVKAAIIETAVEES